MELKLHEGRLYWPQTATESRIFDEILPKEAVDVVIVGAGMSGALSAYRLARAGYKVVVIDQDRVGQGSTAANTGLIQYMSDMGLTEYAKQIGQEEAEAFYQMSLDAIDTLTDIHRHLHGNENSDIFRTGRSLLLATEKRAVRKLKKELKKEQAEGYEVEGIEEETLAEEGYDAYWGLESGPDIALNPFRFVLQILQRAREFYGLQVFEMTKFVDVAKAADGRLTIQVEQFGRKQGLTSPRIIYATGYAPPKHIEPHLKNIQLYKSYVVVSQLLPEETELPERLIWEKKDPYTYLRSTFEPRLMIGGMDRKGKKLSSKDAVKNEENLIEAASRLMPKVELAEGEEERSLDILPAYSYSAIFGESKDDLPYIGLIPGSTQEYVICGLGGNGTVYSAIASEFVLQWLNGEQPRYKKIFAPGR